MNVLTERRIILEDKMTIKRATACVLSCAFIFLLVAFQQYTSVSGGEAETKTVECSGTAYYQEVSNSPKPFSGIIQDITKEDAEINDNTEEEKQQSETDNIAAITGTTEISTKAQTEHVSRDSICFIGDSRTVGMSMAVKSDVMFIAKGSMGLKWLLNTAEPQMLKIKDKIKVCFIQLGVNDLYNKDKYPKELNRIANANPDIKFVFVNVAPVIESKCHTVTNKKICEFNYTVASKLNEKWTVADQYGFFQTINYQSSDGLHFSLSTYKQVYNWLVKNYA